MFGYERRTRAHTKILRHAFQASSLPCRAQIFEPFNWFKGYKIAYLYLHLVDFLILGKRTLLIAIICKHRNERSNKDDPGKAIRAYKVLCTFNQRNLIYRVSQKKV